MKYHLFGVHNPLSTSYYSVERDDCKKRDSLGCSMCWLERSNYKNNRKVARAHLSVLNMIKCSCGNINIITFITEKQLEGHVCFLHSMKIHFSMQKHCLNKSSRKQFST